ncbi:MAG TPA: leucyl aminopeptidase family protein [Jiangellaceae bacterium]|nr:leucyl aminopeptidase family protein [Jiangellaceae bacterium]
MTTVTPTAVVSSSAGVLEVDARAVALPMWPGEDGPWIGPGAEEVMRVVELDPFDFIELQSKSGKAGEVVAMPGRGAVRRVLLVGLGDGTPAAHRKAGAALARAARGLERLASAVTAASGDAELRAFLEGLLLAPYAWRVKGTARKAPLERAVLVMTEPERAAVAQGIAVGRAAWLARDLVHTPSNTKDPAWLAAEARKVADGGDLTVRVRDESDLTAEGFGGIVGVGMGSERPPRLIELGYTPGGAGPDTPHVVIVGKGITFDTGGLSLKPNDGMKAMKTDMSGGAVVIGVMSELRALRCPVRVTGLVPAAENMPSGSAQRPSDVIRQYDGTTVEVRNTDAEGRLVLADAMGYAVRTLSPDAIIDVATLTGAATMGLGRRHAALYATSERLAASLADAGEAAGERLWRMPLVDDYREALDSDIADVAHVETRKTSVGAGSIIAALFLERFAGDVPWAHLDIAGPGRADAAQHEIVKGGTAFGVRALLYWLSTPSIMQLWRDTPGDTPVDTPEKEG